MSLGLCGLLQREVEKEAYKDPLPLLVSVQYHPHPKFHSPVEIILLFLTE
jgi:hypothetical protein